MAYDWDQHIRNQVEQFNRNLKQRKGDAEGGAVIANAPARIQQTPNGDLIIPAKIVSSLGQKVLVDLLARVKSMVERPAYPQGYEDGGIVFNDTTAEGVANTSKAESGGMGGGYSASVVHFEDPKPTPPPVATPTPSTTPAPTPSITPQIGAPSTSPISQIGSPTPSTSLIQPSKTLTPDKGYGSFSVEGGPKVDYADIGKSNDPFASSPGIFSKTQKQPNSLTGLSTGLKPSPSLQPLKPLTGDKGYGSFSVEGGPKVDYADIGTNKDTYAD